MEQNTPAQAPEVSAAQVEVTSIVAALKIVPAGSAAAEALTASLEIAAGKLALAEAEAERQTQRLADIAAANAAADTAKLPDAVRAAMLAAIEAAYAPAPIVEPLQAPDVAVSAKKPVSARTAAINAAAASGMSPEVRQRCVETLAGFDSKFAGDLSGVARTSGTRFCSIAAFGGAGVTGAADYQSLVASLRYYMRHELGVSGNGDSYATNAWLFATGLHAAGAAKGNDSLPLKFLSRASVALCADGRFRLALPQTTGVRFVARDSAALAQWHGTAAQAPVAPAVAPEVTVAAPVAPTPPAQAASASGAIVAVASCQHCSIRNAVGSPACKICKAADWNSAA